MKTLFTFPVILFLVPLWISVLLHLSLKYNINPLYIWLFFYVSFFSSLVFFSLSELCFFKSCLPCPSQGSGPEVSSSDSPSLSVWEASSSPDTKEKQEIYCSWILRQWLGSCSWCFYAAHWYSELRWAVSSEKYICSNNHTWVLTEPCLSIFSTSLCFLVFYFFYLQPKNN